MEQIQGITISKLGFVPQKLGDILEYEGPLLSLFIDQENPENHFLYKWVDNDDFYNRWIIVPFSTKDLDLFFNGELTLRQLFLSKPFCYLIDLDDQLNYHTIQIVATEKLNEEYLPSEKSYYQAEIYSQFAANYHQKLALNTTDLLDNVLKEISALKISQQETTRALNDLLRLQASH